MENSNRYSRGVSVDGTKFRSLRRRCGLTQEEAANHSGYSERLIRKLERGGPVDLRSARDVYQAYSELNDPEYTLGHLIGEGESRLNESLLRQWFDRVFNHRDIGMVDQVIAENVVLYAEGRSIEGREAIRERVTALLSAFNPLHHTIDRVVTEGNQVAAYWSVRKKHSGEFLGIQPTDLWVEVKGSSFVVFEQGQIVQARDHWDVQDLISQLTNSNGHRE